MRKTVIWSLWLSLLLIVLGIGFTFTAISRGWVGYVPPIEELENPNLKFATQVLSDDGKLLGTWSLSKENRLFVGYDQLPPALIEALVATEDVRFREHSGIDYKALGRAVVKRGILMQKSAGGGSTITQQLAKLLYSPTADNFVERLLQKPIEWVIAIKLERYYTKEEIITMYLNKFDFLNNAVGIKSAAKTYFSKEPKDLTIEEAATLVGMCKNPSLFNPRRFNERARERRNVVLSQMEKAGFITSAECATHQAKPLVLKVQLSTHKEGLATYLREYLRTIMTAKEPKRSNYASWQKQKFYEDSVQWKNNPLYGWCNKNTKKDGSHYNLYTDGLKIYTSIDSRMQQYAEEAVYEHVAQFLQKRFFREKKGKNMAPYDDGLTPQQVDKILQQSVRQTERYRLMKNEGCSNEEIRKAFLTPTPMTVFSWEGSKDTIMTPMDSIKYYKHFLRAGFMAMEPTTGYVKAYVGGPNYHYFQYDMAMVGRRQVGSTIKPFLYSLAMENGYSPCDVAPNVQVTLYDEVGRPYTPRNSSHSRVGEYVTLKWGLANSNNWISAYLMARLNPYSLVRLIHSFGVLNQDIQPTVSLCLGPCEISVGEMVSAYTAFANNGIRTSPLFVTRIEDGEGNVIATFTPQVDEVISESTAHKMITMLRGVINEGTGSRIRRIYNITADMGGKTGTTNDNSDGWFIGFTPRLVAGVWVGGEDRNIHFNSMADGQGASMALPVWGIFMNKVYKNKALGYSQTEVFNLPAGFDPCGSKNSESSETPEEPNELDDAFLDR